MTKKVKEWYNRHENLVIKDGWTKEEYDYILDNIIYCKIKTIDELLTGLQNKDIYQLVDLLQNDLKIGGKPLKLILHCAYCGNQIIKNINFIHQNRVYCNMNCRNKYKVEYGVHKGENNPKYNSREISCTNCGKIFMAPKYIQNQTNSYGDNNHFCSKQCYWEYRSKYYVGEKSSMYKHQYTQYERQKMRIRNIQMFAEGKFPTKLTSIHKKINNLLEELNIKYENEKSYKYYSADIYLPEYDLIIEIMGDYFHGNPLLYEHDNLNNMQLKNIKKDKSKHTYIKRYYNIEILYLWEQDINHNLELCRSLILQYIRTQGKLQEYHSYKYN